MFDSPTELLRKIRLGEDTALELKAVTIRGDRMARPRRDDLADEIAAMANTASAVLLLGVDDKNRDIIGIQIEHLEVVERAVYEICNDTIKPSVAYRAYRLELPDSTGELKAVLRIEIPRSLYVHKSPGGYFRRQGSSKREMPPDILARLFQQRSQSRIIRFDEQVVATAPRSALDKALWRKFRTPLSPSDDDEFLSKLKLVSRDEDGVVRPTVSGILMATERPDEFISNAFIQAVAYRGTERNAAYQVDAHDIVGPLDVQISAAYQFVLKNMRVYATKQPGRRDVPQYAMEAVFEALVNAVAHRDYSVGGSKIRLHLFADRLELSSPGAIPNTMTIESLPLRQAARNELLTSLLARCPMNLQDFPGSRGFLMDKRGEGVPIILTASRALSGRLPSYQLIDESELRLTIYAAPAPTVDGPEADE